MTLYAQMSTTPSPSELAHANYLAVMARSASGDVGATPAGARARMEEMDVDSDYEMDRDAVCDVDMGVGVGESESESEGEGAVPADVSLHGLSKKPRPWLQHVYATLKDFRDKTVDDGPAKTLGDKDIKVGPAQENTITITVLVGSAMQTIIELLTYYSKEHPGGGGGGGGGGGEPSTLTNVLFSIDAESGVLLQLQYCKKFVDWCDAQWCEPSADLCEEAAKDVITWNVFPALREYRVRLLDIFNTFHQVVLHKHEGENVHVLTLLNMCNDTTETAVHTSKTAELLKFLVTQSLTAVDDHYNSLFDWIRDTYLDPQTKAGAKLLRQIIREFNDIKSSEEKRQQFGVDFKTWMGEVVVAEEWETEPGCTMRTMIMAAVDSDSATNQDWFKTAFAYDSSKTSEQQLGLLRVAKGYKVKFLVDVTNNDIITVSDAHTALTNAAATTLAATEAALFVNWDKHDEFLRILPKLPFMSRAIYYEMVACMETTGVFKAKTFAPSAPSAFVDALTDIFKRYVITGSEAKVLARYIPIIFTNSTILKQVRSSAGAVERCDPTKMRQTRLRTKLL